MPGEAVEGKVLARAQPQALLLQLFIRGEERRLARPSGQGVRIAELEIGVEAEKLLWLDMGRTYGMHLTSAIVKEFQPEFGQTCMEILGPLAQIQTGEWAPLAGEVDRIYRRSFGNHAGGTSQVKRMVVATRVLGLPR